MILTYFWKVKGNLFSCKCGKANCSISKETMNSFHIDSNYDAKFDGYTDYKKLKKIKYR